MSREILAEFARAGISIASGTYEIVGFPEVKVRMVDGLRPQHIESSEETPRSQTAPARS